MLEKTKTLQDILKQKSKLEKAVRKVGGKFKLTVLLQKRVQELNSGATKLVDTDSNDPIAIALDEVLQDKIKLIEDVKYSER